MADAQRTIDLIFNGVDKTGEATQAVLKNTEKFAGSLQSATQPIADFTAGALKVEAALLAAGAAVTVFSINVAGDFDSAFREIATLIDEPIDGLNEFREAILSYASGSTQPLDQVTQALYNAISAGVNYGEAIDAVSQAEKLAVAGRGDLNDSTLVLVSSLNAYGLGMDQAKRFSDALFTTVKQGQTTLPELSASLALVTGTAATLEVPFETLLSSIAALTSTGTPTAQAVTQINSVLSAFLKPSKEASDTAKELGIDFSSTALKTKGLEVVLAEIAGTTGITDEQLGKLFGSQEALRAVFPLTGASAGKLKENLDAMGTSAGATQTAFEKMSGSVELAGQKAKNAFEGLLVSIGTPLLDEAGGISEAISAIFNAIGDSANQGGVKALVEFVESQLQGLQQTLETVALNLPNALNQADLSGFIGGIEAIREAFGNIFDGIDLSSTEGLKKAIESVGNAFEGLSNFSAGVIESFKPLIGVFIDASGNLTDVDKESFRAAGSFAGFVTQLNLGSGVVVSVAGTLLALNEALKLGGTISAAVSALGAVGAGGLLGSLGTLAALGAAGGAGYGVATLANELAELATGTSISTWVVDTLLDLGVLDSKAEEIAKTLNDSTAPAFKNAGAAAKASAADLKEFDVGLIAIDAGIGTITDLSDILLEASNSTDTLTDSGKKYGGTFSVITNETLKAADAQAKLKEEAEKTEKVLISLIEAQASVAIAQIEADATKTVSAFESINVAIESTGEQLTSLFGLLGDDSISKLDKLDIAKQIELENERRDDALKLQQKLTEAQIKALNAQAARLASGGALITVNGDGLAPHLEAMMFEVLEAVQVRVNADGYATLLGVA